ncbi:MAG: hypothetical protein J7M26_03205 [Armatimonadetes bacterium]|nr:hypothetical protein [Armatimonadota bacterium]
MRVVRVVLLGVVVFVAAGPVLSADPIPVLDPLGSYGVVAVTAWDDWVFLATRHCVYLGQYLSGRLVPQWRYYCDQEIRDVAIWLSGSTPWLLVLHEQGLDVVDVTSSSEPVLHQRISRPELTNGLAMDVNADISPGLGSFVVYIVTWDGTKGRLVGVENVLLSPICKSCYLPFEPNSVTGGFNRSWGAYCAVVGGTEGIAYYDHFGSLSLWSVQPKQGPLLVRSLNTTPEIAWAGPAAWMIYDYSNPLRPLPHSGSDRVHTGRKIAIANFGGVPWYLVGKDGGVGYELWRGQPNNMQLKHEDSVATAVDVADLKHGGDLWPVLAESDRLLLLDSAGGQRAMLEMPQVATAAVSLGNTTPHIYTLGRYGLTTSAINFAKGRYEWKDFLWLPPATGLAFLPPCWLYTMSQDCHGQPELVCLNLSIADHPRVEREGPRVPVGTHAPRRLVANEHRQPMLAIITDAVVFFYSLASSTNPTYVLRVNMHAGDVAFEWPWIYATDRTNTTLLRAWGPDVAAGTWAPETRHFTASRMVAVAASGSYVFFEKDSRILIYRSGPPGEVMRRVQSIPVDSGFEVRRLAVLGRFLYALLDAPSPGGGPQVRVYIYDLSPLPEATPELVASAELPGPASDFSPAPLTMVIPGYPDFEPAGLFVLAAVLDTRNWQAIAPPGDIDGDGVLSLQDVSDFLRWLRSDGGGGGGGREMMWRCDTNQDGKVNHEDVRRVVESWLQSQQGQQ